MFYYNVKAVSCEVSFGLSAVTKSYNCVDKAQQKL